MKQTSFSDERIEELLRSIPKQDTHAPSQENIEKIVIKAKEIMIAQEKIDRIDFVEFILVQMRIMSKRWWMMQGALLFLAGEWLFVSGGTDYMHRGLSILAALFVILIIPELWKNIEHRSLEIEESSLFDLRRVYAAKLIAFGVIDTVLLSLFCISAAQMQEIVFADILKQFVFPVMVAAAICLMSFSSKKCFNELTTMIICGIANVIWTLIALNEVIYSKITPLIWLILFSICICLIAYSVHKALHKNTESWEVQLNGLNIG